MAVVRTSAIRALLPFSLARERAYNFLLKRTCCHSTQVIGVTSDPRITYPYLLKICASTPGLRSALAGFCGVPARPESVIISMRRS